MTDEDAPPAVGDADADVVAGLPPASERVSLSRERIVAAAVAFIDDQGLPALSMRRLAESLGVEAMALYPHVPGREALLDQVVDLVLSDLGEDGRVPGPLHGWQDFLQRMAHGVRRVALAHPLVFPLVVARPAEAPWLRPPLRSLALVECFLDGLSSEGFSDAAAVEAYRGFTSFLLGHLLLEVSTYGADVGPLDTLAEPAEPAGDALASYPMVERVGAQLAQDHAAREFDDSLESLLDRLAIALLADRD